MSNSFRNTGQNRALFASSSSSDDDDGKDEDYAEKVANLPKKRQRSSNVDSVEISNKFSEIGDSSTVSSLNVRSDQVPQAKKTNNVWSDFVAEEQLVSGMGGSLAVKKQTVNRGVESYTVDPSVIFQSYEEAKSPKEPTTEEDGQPMETTAKKDSVQQIHKGGNRRRMNDKRYRQQHPMHFGIEFSSDELDIPDNVDCCTNTEMVIQPDPNNKATDGNSEAMEDSGSSVSDEKRHRLADKLAFALREQKVDLIESCLRWAGVKKCMDIYHETAKIERQGGWLTLDQQRRRSPGGVYLALLKQDKDLTPVAYKQIFGHDQPTPEERQRNILTAKRQLGAKKYAVNPPVHNKDTNISFEQSLLDLKKLAEKSTAKAGDSKNSDDSLSSTGKVWKTKQQVFLEEIQQKERDLGNDNCSKCLDDNEVKDDQQDDSPLMSSNNSVKEDDCIHFDQPV